MAAHFHNALQCVNDVSECLRVVMPSTKIASLVSTLNLKAHSAAVVATATEVAVMKFMLCMKYAWQAKYALTALTSSRAMRATLEQIVRLCCCGHHCI